MRNRRYPSYNDDADYTTNAPSYYDDLARKEKLIRHLAERIWGYEKILDETLEQIQERFRAWDKNLEDFPEDVKKLLQKWMDNGTLDHIINETIFNWKLDTSIFEQFRDSISEIMVNIRDFGAIYDDPTFDNMIAISNAQNYLEAKGGGTIFIPNDGVLYIKPFLNIKKNIKLLGAIGRTTLKLQPTVTDFWKVFGFENQENQSLENIEIDCNFEERSGYNIDTSPQILISLAGTKNFEMKNCKLIGNGVWIIAAFTGDANYSRHLRFRDNHIIWKGGHSTQKPGLPEGVQIDNTAVYFDAIDYLFENNFIETNDGLKNMTCIEAHGVGATVKNNTIIGFRTGIIVWSLVSATNEAFDSNRMKINDNHFIRVENGISVGATTGYHLKDVALNGNNILLDPKHFGRGSSRGIDLYFPVDSICENLDIYENNIESLPDNTTYSDSGFASNFAGISVLSGIFKNMVIKLNTLKNITGTGILFSTIPNMQTKVLHSNMEHNTIINAGSNLGIAETTSTGRSAIALLAGANTDLSGLFVGVNTIIDDRPSGTYYTRPLYGAITGIQQQKLKTSARPDWFAKRDFIPGLFFDGQLGTITTTKKGHYQVGDNMCKVRMEIEVTATTLTQGYSATIELPIEANITDNYFGGRYTILAPDATSTGVLRIPTVNKKIINFMPNASMVKFPVGTRVIIEMDYPISALNMYTV